MTDTPQTPTAAATPDAGAPKVKKSVALSGTPAGNTALCTVGRSGNDLHYRGYDIHDLATLAQELDSNDRLLEDFPHLRPARDAKNPRWRVGLVSDLCLVPGVFLFPGAGGLHGGVVLLEAVASHCRTPLYHDANIHGQHKVESRSSRLAIHPSKELRSIEAQPEN